MDIKSCRIKVFVIFCYLDGRNGSLSHFANAEAGHGNFSEYTGLQQQPNIQSVPKALEKKITTALEQNPVTELCATL